MFLPKNCGNNAPLITVTFAVEYFLMFNNFHFLQEIASGYKLLIYCKLSVTIPTYFTKMDKMCSCSVFQRTGIQS